MSDRRATLNLVLALALVVALIVWVRERDARSKAERRAATATAAADSLRRRGDSLAAHYTVDTLRMTRWQIRWDSVTLPGRVDSVPVSVIIAVGDSTIQACTLALRTCEERAKTERERGDSARSASRNWERLARGPWIHPRFELTTTPQLEPQAAAELTIGRGRLKALGRAEVGSDAVIRLGLSWTP